ncbi:MAG: glycosyltransferase family 2 protein [Myxococcota bacterium]
MDIGVVIPTANRRPDHLLRAVRSVLDQKPDSARRVELVVANNSDRPIEGDLARLAEGGALRIVDASRVRGASHARNRGAAATVSSLLAFLDDDDWWEPAFLKELGGTLVREDADMVCCGFWNWKPGPVRLTGKQMRVVPTEEKLFLKNPGFRGSNFLMRRTLFDATRGFDESLPTSNDKDFLIRFLRAGGRLFPLQRRLVNLDRGEHERLTRASWNKVAGTRRFLELHAPHMEPSLCRRLLFKLRLQTALTSRSYATLAGLAVERPGRAWELFGLGRDLARGRRVRV